MCGVPETRFRYWVYGAAAACVMAGVQPVGPANTEGRRPDHD